MKKCFFLFALAGMCTATWAESERAVEQPTTKTRVPIGADRLDPVLEDTRQAAQTARRQWRSALRQHLIQAEADVGRMLSPTEMALAEAAFIREYFEDYVAMETLQQEHREKLSVWARSHETYVSGEDAVQTDSSIYDPALSESERAELKALRKVSLQLLELEARADAQLQADSSKATQPTE